MYNTEMMNKLRSPGISECSFKLGSLPHQIAIVDGSYCFPKSETQWRHSVKKRLYNTPSPILNSVKRSDVTRWKEDYITPPPPYLILWNAVTSLGENKAI